MTINAAWHPWETKNVPIKYGVSNVYYEGYETSEPVNTYDWLFVFAHYSERTGLDPADNEYQNELLLPLGWYAGDIAYPRSEFALDVQHVFYAIFAPPYDPVRGRVRFWIWSNEAQSWCVENETAGRLVASAAKPTVALYRKRDRPEWLKKSPAPPPYNQPFASENPICVFNEKGDGRSNDSFVRRLCALPPWPDAPGRRIA